MYDYYRERHGRDSLDGRGMAVHSLVGVTQLGQPYINAFWDGSKMVYGGDAEYRTLSAGLDVVGHEMTHGVVEHSANLVHAGQSGALNEAVADYFGNAVETDIHGIPMDSPDSGLLGETLCRNKPARECATRDLNDGRTTSKSFLGVSFSVDNGGVHLNSTIFSGALWDLREDLGKTLADRIVYKALTEYLTPLDGFTEGRAAVLAAARDLNATGSQLRSAERAFSAHDIVPGWELAMGVDSDPLLGRVNTDGSASGAGGGWWAAAKSNDDGTEPYSVWAGRADGTGAQKLMSPNDGRYHVHPATDSRTVVWLAVNRRSVDVLARPIAGGPVKTLWSGRRGASDLRVEGDVVVFETRPADGAPVPRRRPDRVRHHPPRRSHPHLRRGDAGPEDGQAHDDGTAGAPGPRRADRDHRPARVLAGAHGRRVGPYGAAARRTGRYGGDGHQPRRGPGRPARLRPRRHRRGGHRRRVDARHGVPQRDAAQAVAVPARRQPAGPGALQPRRTGVARHAGRAAGGVGGRYGRLHRPGHAGPSGRALRLTPPAGWRSIRPRPG